MTDQQILREQAKNQFFEHQSFRAIAASIGISHVTISRWAKEEDWEGQRKQRELSAQEYEHQKYLDLLTEVKDRHLKVSRQGMELALYALRQYFEYDQYGNVIGVKLNKWGVPAIGGRTLVQLLQICSEIELKALGFTNGLPAPDVEKMVASSAPKTVDADPDWVKKLGDAAAKMGMEND